MTAPPALAANLANPILIPSTQATRMKPEAPQSSTMMRQTVQFALITFYLFIVCLTQEGRTCAKERPGRSQDNSTQGVIGVGSFLVPCGSEHQTCWPEPLPTEPS